MKLARFLGSYFLRYLGWVFVALVASGVFAMATGAIIVLIEPIFTEVLLADKSELGEFAPLAGGGSEEGEGGSKGEVMRFFHGAYESLKEALEITPEGTVYFLPILLAFVFLTRSASDFVSGYCFNRISWGVTTDIRNDLYESVLGQSSRFHALHPSGELISRIVNDVGMMQTAVSSRVVDLVQQGITLITLVVLLFSTHFRLAVICVVVLPLLLFPIVRFGRGMRRTSHISQERMADLANLVGEGVRGHRVVKAFGMEGFEMDRFREATRRHLKVNLWAQLLANASSPVVEALLMLGGVVLLIYAGQQIRSGELSGPLFLTFLATLIWMYEPARKLNKANIVVQQSLAAVRRVYDLMEIPNEIVDKPDARRLTSLERGIRFRGLSFAYSDKLVLHDVDLELSKGEIVAMVGPSGAGKSTVANLLPRFFDPDVGAVELDGIDVRDLSLESLRGLIGIVTQETVLFNDTVRANIAYGREDLALEHIREAAAAAYADEFISELKDGYDTTIGEGGLRLSGGQRQRLAIARALIKNPPILILDEATSQLDTESEALVQKALYNLMEGRTTLVIAHRLSTVKKADRIVVLEAGRVVEQGSHAQLLALGGIYKRLHDLQFRA
jgi:subfamily B ATP-binding cassette protein MsbA